MSLVTDRETSMNHNRNVSTPSWTGRHPGTTRLPSHMESTGTSIHTFTCHVPCLDPRHRLWPRVRCQCVCRPPPHQKLFIVASSNENRTLNTRAPVPLDRKSGPRQGCVVHPDDSFTRKGPKSKWDTSLLWRDKARTQNSFSNDRRV